MADRGVPSYTTSGTVGAAAERVGVQGGGVAGDPGATGRGAANTMTDMGSLLAGGASEPTGRDMRPLGVHETSGDEAARQYGPQGLTSTGGAEMHPGSAATGFGGTAGTHASPAAAPMGGGRAMEPGMGQEGFGGGASSGTAGTVFTGQGLTGHEAMGGGVMDPTPVDKHKPGA